MLESTRCGRIELFAAYFTTDSYPHTNLWLAQVNRIMRPADYARKLVNCQLFWIRIYSFGDIYGMLSSKRFTQILQSKICWKWGVRRNVFSRHSSSAQTRTKIRIPKALVTRTNLVVGVFLFRFSLHLRVNANIQTCRWSLYLIIFHLWPCSKLYGVM